MRSKKTDWPVWFRQNLFSIITLASGIVAFVFLQLNTIGEIKYTVNNQKEQFLSMQKTFADFDKTQKSNYEDYAKNQKADTEKVNGLIKDLGLAAVRTGTQVESVAKQLDEVKSKLEGISSRQQENRQIFQQGSTRR